MVFSIDWIDGQVFHCISPIRNFIFYWNESFKDVIYWYYAVMSFGIKVGSPQFDVTSFFFIVNAEVVSYIILTRVGIPSNVCQIMF